ncbi:hypothetical protein [Streptococcus anginosus]|uniref:hypothetical protein n=1 Tax=Streptococcus anginosus TaxID=1328 RepID=UPI0012456E5F|nr:hypothetical protein [Streptococcus anginosus]MED5840687.1 hypothetical protein [Streptococcus anginosus]WIK85747.1 hypothetical protein F6I26_008110 [Streptococcus anginosus]
MKIKQNNRFKIKNIELIRQLKEGDKLSDKYFIFINDAMGGIPCHNRSFGSKADFEYGPNYEVLSQFYADKGYMELSCCAFGGMCGFTLDTDEISTGNTNNLERECAGYVQNDSRKVKKPSAHSTLVKSLTRLLYHKKEIESEQSESYFKRLEEFRSVHREFN